MSARPAALFGKLPTSLDFVRIHHGSPAAIELDTWTEQALTELVRANASWPAMSMRFLFAPLNTEDALVGILCKSRDRAGRGFPVAIYASVPAATLAPLFAAVPDAWAPFLDAAEALVADAERLSREELTQRLEALAGPSLEAQKEALTRLDAGLRQRTREDFAASLGSRLASPEAAAAALRPTADAPVERPQVLDCPVSQPADVFAWLALARRCLCWPARVPSFFWTAPGADGRLLLMPGPAPILVPAWLAAPTRSHARLVRLTASPSPPSMDPGASLFETFARLVHTADPGDLT